jgi:hypothetical protein
MFNPKTFWANTPIGEKAQSDKVPVLPFDLPDLMVEINGKTRNYFDVIGMHIIKCAAESIVKDAFVNLDYEWSNNPNPDLAKARANYHEKYPLPYCNRKAFQLLFLFEPVLDAKGQVVKENGSIKTVVGGMKMGKPEVVENGKTTQKATNPYCYAFFCGFECEKYKKEKAPAQARVVVDEKTGAVQEIPPEFDSPEPEVDSKYPFCKVMLYMSKATAETLLAQADKIKKANPAILSLDTFGLTNDFYINDWTKDGTPKKGPKSYKGSVDHFFFEV